MNKKYQVFVSSTFQDLIEERAEVIMALLELDCIPNGMELFPSGDDSQWTYIQKVIDNCDYYVLVSAGRYGTIGKDGKSYTQMEYEYALSKNIPVIAFLHKDLASLTVGKSEIDPAKKEKLEAFRNLAQRKLCRYWAGKNELSALVSRSIVKLIKDKPARGWIKSSEVGKSNFEDQIDRLFKEIHEVKQGVFGNKLVENYSNVPLPPEARPDDNEKIELGIVGISYAPSQSGMYFLIFDNNENDLVVSVAIDGYGAQAIAVELEKTTPSRPIAHDIIKSTVEAFGFSVSEVFIYDYIDGVFYSFINFSNGSRNIKIDCRTSDAIAVALRFGAPVFTFKEVIQMVGIGSEGLDIISKNN